MQPSDGSKAVAPNASADDYALMSALSARDAGALAALYDRYGGIVYALCLRVLRDAGEAEDLLIDVFWELWERAGRYDPGRGRPLAHILGLARSRAIDRLRSRRGRARLHAEPDADSASAAPQSPAPTPPQAAILAEQQQRLAAAMNALPPEQRQPLELAFFDGMSHAEVAARLQEPLGTVKSRIRQALIRIRQLIGGDNAGSEDREW